MAKANTYEQQAKLSVTLAGVAGVCMLALLGLLLQKFNFSEFEIVMRSGGTRFLAILGSSLVASVCAAAGVFIGLNSVHRLNKKTQLSWAGFFANAAILGITLSVFIVFWLTKETLKIVG